ncbi:MAG: choice-of-anchor Q domain-containing protein [Planctomycetota bacterium]|jgi:predicted outer membrane repeat protein
MKRAMVAILLVTGWVCEARIITVDDDGPADFSTIQAAINDASDGDTVEIRPGTYTGPGNRDMSFQGKAITVTGTDPYDPNTVALTIIDCNATETNRHRAFDFVSGEGRDSVLAGVSIINGYGHDEDVGNRYLSSAGAIWCEGSSPTIIGCQIRNNIVGHMGGGMYCKGSDPLITNCLFSGNIGYNAGAIGNENSSPTIINCVFTSNAVPEEGGAMYNSYGSRAVISNCVFSKNSARGGGAIYDVGGSSSTLINCVFKENGAGYGGAVKLSESSARFLNCVFMRNSASTAGGAICNSENNPLIANCTFTDNSAGDGHMIANYYGGRPTLTNCLVWSGSGDYESTIFLREHSSILIRYSDIRGGEAAVEAIEGSWCDWGEGNIDLDPLFDSDKYHLQSGSPCIDCGDSSGSYCSGSDIDGQSRLIGAGVDIGADEYGTEPPPLLFIHPSTVEAKAVVGETNPVTAVVRLFATGIEEVDWTLSENCSWLDVADDSGTFAGGSVEIELTINAEGLPKGRHSCDIGVSDGHPEHGFAVATVDLVVYTQGQLLVPAQFTTIQAAIDASDEGETVLVADGNYTGYGNQDVDFRGKKITVRSERGPESCVIDCEGGARGFYFHSGEDENSVLHGFTIANGYCGRGGAVRCLNSSPMITDCRFVGNSSSGNGGAVKNTGGIPKLSNCVFSQNTAERGGAIENHQGYCILIDSIFLDNSARQIGGAIYDYVSRSTLTRCIFTGNSAGSSGGALYGHAGGSKVTNCIFTGNSAGGNGGAVYAYNGSKPVITNCTFTGNQAWMTGGAIVSRRNSDPVLTNCILYANRASKGNAISVLEYVWTRIYTSEMTVKYSDVEGGYDSAYVEDGCRVNWHEGNIRPGDGMQTTDDGR